MGIIGERIQKATGGGAHMPNGSGSGYDRVAKAGFSESEHPRKTNGEFAPKAGDRVSVGDVSSQLHGAVDAKVVGRSKTMPATHTVVEAGGRREAVRTDSLSPGVGHSSHPAEHRGGSKGHAVDDLIATERRRKVAAANKKNRDELAAMHQRRAEAAHRSKPKLVDARNMTPGQKIKNFEVMHGRPPTAAELRRAGIR